MEQNQKKLLLIGITVGCLVLAAGITLLTRSRSGGIPEHFADEMIWVKCAKCGHAYQITKKEYFEYQQKHDDPSSPIAPLMVCPKCGEKAVLRAVKCEKCGEVFFWGSIPGDFDDRCPKCGYSKKEVERGMAPKQ